MFSSSSSRVSGFMFRSLIPLELADNDFPKNHKQVATKHMRENCIKWLIFIVTAPLITEIRVYSSARKPDCQANICKVI